MRIINRLAMLHRSLIISRVQYEITAWGRAASCHQQPIAVVLNLAMSCLNTSGIAILEVANLYKTLKILRLKDIYSLEVGKFMYKYSNSQLPATFTDYFKLITNAYHIYSIVSRTKWY